MNGKAVAALIAALLAGSALAYLVASGDDDEQAVETVTVPVTQEITVPRTETEQEQPADEPPEDAPGEEPTEDPSAPDEPAVTSGQGGGVQAP